MDDITPGELSRRLDRLEESLRDIRQDIRDINFVHRDVYSSDQKMIWAAIGEMQEKDKRRTGWIATGIILPVLLIVILQLLQLQ